MGGALGPTIVLFSLTQKNNPKHPEPSTMKTTSFPLAPSRKNGYPK